MGIDYFENREYNILNKALFLKKQARKGFRSLSAMKGIGYFQNLWNFFKIVWKFFGILLQDFLEDFFGGIFWSNFLGKKFLEDFNFFGRILGRIFREKLFGRNSLFTLICQDFSFCQDFVSIKKEGGQEFK